MNAQQSAKQSIEKKINAALAAMPAEQRPEARMRGQRYQSVAVSTVGWYEATTSNGHTEMVSQEEALGWTK